MTRLTLILGATATAALIDFPKFSKPETGQVCPLNTTDQETSAHNESEITLKGIHTTVALEIHGAKYRRS